jgi:hypothetical protein
MCPNTCPRCVRSIHPVKRCQIFGFDNSHVIFVRGAQDDIDAVREIVAEFDRPAPQALIKLYTLQLNGSDPNNMARNISLITSELNELQGNLTLILDCLRNAIAKEVSRKQRVAKNVLKDFDLSDRLLRSFYYPEEIRKRLGFDIAEVVGDVEVFDLKNKFSIFQAIDDIEQATVLFKDALHAHAAACTYRLDEDHQRAYKDAQFKREMRLTQAGYYFNRAYKAMEALSKQPVDQKSNEVKTVKDFDAKMVDLIQSQKNRSDDEYSRLLGFSSETKLAGVPEDKPEDKDKEKSNPDVNEVLEAGKTILDSLIKEAKAKEEAKKEAKVKEEAKKEAKAKDDAKAKLKSALDRIKQITYYTLPDPSSGTTQGEMLFVLCLGDRESRERILNTMAQDLYETGLMVCNSDENAKNFQTAISRFKDVAQSSSEEEEKVGAIARAYNQSASTQGLIRFAAMLERTYGYVAQSSIGTGVESNLFPYLPRTIYGSLAAMPESPNCGETLTPNQKEIINALETQARSRCAIEILSICSKIANLASRNLDTDLVATQAQDTVNSLFSWMSKQNNQNDQNIWKDQLLNTESNRSIAEALAEFFGVQNSLSSATPRVAAADDMIKRFIVVWDADMQHFLVGPALDRIRMLTNGKNVQFGQLQCESILASNRYAARVDVSASASLENQGIEQALDVTEQLTMIRNSLLTKARDDKVEGMGALLGPESALVASQYLENGIDIANWGLMGTLLGSVATPTSPPAEIYSLNGGTQFKVTPIFDPSGQAMRFKFDHVETVRIQDPNNVDSIFAPRVDRHTTNTEVHLSNGQFQVISSYDLNSKIGMSGSRSGGIPPLNHIKELRQIPFIGYFVKRDGQRAVRQHSLIFASTTMYPTVGDIVNLLIEAPVINRRSIKPQKITAPKCSEKPETPQKASKLEAK